MAVIGGLQCGFAARGFRTCLLSTAAGISVLCNSFSARGFGLFQRFTRSGKSSFGLRNMHRCCSFFRIRYGARFSRITIRAQRRMSFARAAETRLGSSQFRFGGLQLRGTRSGGFSRLIGCAFGFAHRFNRFGKRCGGGIAPRG